MTRCKVGDLAVIVRAKKYRENIGKIVKVLRPSVDGEILNGIRTTKNHMTVGWVVEGRGLAWGTLMRHVVNVRAIADENLRPIRDPGEDAQDESVRWLPPVPTQTKEMV